ncbi:hypothetical protein AB0442_38430 [Kitasatospora sp. NPDC085895]|uniref:hypothetical protein n=1 Tax=Kitasatospora sp. NPDC085895 TaxID=3155057 RepID=UPI00344CE7AB
MRFTATPVRIGALAAAGLLAIPLVGHAQAASNGPKVVQDQLGPTAVAADTAATATLAVHSSHCFTADTLGVSVRDLAGKRTDFPGAARSVRICPEGVSITTGALALPAGTYSEFGYWRDLAGSRHNLPARTLTVGNGSIPAPAPSATAASPTASATPSPTATAATPTMAPTSSTPTPLPAPTATQAPAGMRELPAPLYGVTVDDVSNLSAIVDSSKRLSHKPTTRIVFDENVNPSQYTQAVNQLQPVSYLMGEILDSSYIKDYSAQAYHDRVAQYLNAFGDQVDLWEIGNEVNGNWTGNYSDLSAKITDAYSQVEAAGKRTALTLYYDIGCGNGPSELDPIAFTNQYVPADMRNGLDYVTLSYYEADCNDIRPSAATWTAYFQQLHTLYPNAELAFGEIGLPNPVTTTTQDQATTLLNYYYGLHIDLPYYAGGYFWWNYAEDMLPATKPMWQSLNTAFTTMPVPTP